MRNILRVYGPKIGPFSLGAMAFFGVFARGILNTSFGILLVWGVVYLYFKEKGHRQPSPPIPRLWLEAIALFLSIYVIASLAGAEPLRSLRYTGRLAAGLAAFPLAWLALAEWPKIRRYTPLLYAFGLMVCALIVFKEAGWGLVCKRSRAYIGVIDLGAILGQLAPIMVGALALSLRLGQKKRTLVFLAALVASYVALRISCSRIALIAAPFLSVLIFLVNWKAFSFKWKAAAVILFALASFFTLTDQTIVGRFEEMSEDTGNINNDTRILQWKQGLKAFWDHPVLGNGPSAIPSPPAELLAKSPDGTPAVTWKPYSHSHQAFITVLAESGVIGLIGFLALHLAPWALMWRNLKSSDPEVFFWTWSAAAVTGQFLLNAMTDQLFGMRTLMYIYWTTTATALWLPAYKKLPACKLEEAASGQG